MSIDEVNEIASPLIRKYNWRTRQEGNAVILTVTDGNAESNVEITTGEDIESEIKYLIKAVDAHQYTTIG